MRSETAPTARGQRLARTDHVNSDYRFDRLRIARLRAQKGRHAGQSQFELSSGGGDPAHLSHPDAIATTNEPFAASGIFRIFAQELKTNVGIQINGLPILQCQANYTNVAMRVEPYRATQHQQRIFSLPHTNLVE